MSADQLETWSSAPGVRWASPLGITRTRLATPDGGSASATVFGVRPSGPLSPEEVTDDTLVVSRSLAEEEGIRVGDALHAGSVTLTVAAITDDAHYSHTPVVWTSLHTWNELAASRAGGPGQGPLATVIAADVADGTDTAAIDRRATTTSATIGASLSAIGSFSSENGSLMMMQGFLYAISALVIGAFLTVWTIQRTGDIAVLKALGGSTRYLLRDALAQSFIVLVAGAGVGGAVGVALGSLAAGTVPFVLTPSTTLLPILAMIALGMVGAALAVRRITSVDPLTALGAVR